MVHVLAPRPSQHDIPVFLNIDAPVGRGQPNKPEDVLLVQFLMRKIGENPPGYVTPASAQTLKKVQPTGKVDQATLDGIAAVEKSAKMNDAKVSVAQGYGFGGSQAYVIVKLNAAVKAAYRNVFPNIDQLPGCPGPLATAVRRAFTGA